MNKLFLKLIMFTLLLTSCSGSSKPKDDILILNDKILDLEHEVLSLKSELLNLEAENVSIKEHNKAIEEDKNSFISVVQAKLVHIYWAASWISFQESLFPSDEGFALKMASYTSHVPEAFYFNEPNEDEYEILFRDEKLIVITKSSSGHIVEFDGDVFTIDGLIVN